MGRIWRLFKKVVSGKGILAIRQSQVEWERQFHDGKWDFALHNPNTAMIIDVYLQLRQRDGFLTKVLDVGCGNGAVAATLGRMNAGISYVGVDISQKALEKAKQLYPQGEYIHADIESSPRFNQKFDVMIFSEILYYVDFKKVLREYRKYLHEDGFIVISLYSSWRTKLIWMVLDTIFTFEFYYKITDEKEGRSWAVKAGRFKDKNVMKHKNNTKEEGWEQVYYALAHSDIEKKSHESRHMRLMLDYMREHLKLGDEVLEVGCGVAGFAKMMPEGVMYTGIEFSDYALEKARKEFLGRPQVRLMKGDAEKLSFEDGSFDLVFAKHVIEHLHNSKKAIREMVRVLKSGGTLILVAPNLEFPLAYPGALRHKSALFRVVFHLLRTSDYILRIFGIYRFRTISENYLQATGRYERADDDLVYCASSFEVINFLKRLGMEIVFTGSINFSGKKNFKDRLRWLFTKLPALRYYGVELFVIARKQGGSS